MTEYYKATGPSGRDFYSGTIDYARALETGEVVRHPMAGCVRNQPNTYLSVSVAEADCTGFRWPCRLFRVEPVGEVLDGLSASPNKRAVKALRVVEELPAWRAFGPNGQAVVAFLARLETLTSEQARGLATAWDAALDAAGDAAWAAARAAAGAAAGAAALDAAWAEAWDAAWAAARAAAGAAAGAILVADLITPEQYAILTQPFVDAGLGEWVVRPVVETAVGEG